MRLRATIVGVAITAAALPLSACGSQGSAAEVAKDCKPAHKFSTVTEGKLTVAGYDLPPYSSQSGGKLSGVDPDIVAEIAKMECLTVEAKWMAPAAVIPTVQSNRADLAVGDWYRTQARAQIVSLSDPIYVDQMGISSKDGIDTVAALKGKKVGTVDGYLWVEDLKKYLGDSLRIYPSTVNMNQDLKSGRIEIAVDSYGSQKVTNPSMKIMVAKPDPAVAASQEAAQASLPVPQANTELLKAINEDLKTLRDNGKLKEILVKNGLDASAADTGAARLIS
jgi:polar amino acid transport system substrate-binding protein